MAILKNDELYRFITENSSDVICFQKPSGEFEYVSPNIFELTGYTNEEYIRFGKISNVYPDDHQRLEDTLKRIKEGENLTLVECRIYKKNSTIIWIQIRLKAIRDEKGKLVSIISSSNDITLRKELEIKRKEQDSLFRILFEQSATGILRVAPDGTILQVNKKFCNMLGYSEEELLTMNFAEITHPDDLPLDNKFIKKVLAQEIDHFEIEKRYITKDKRWLWTRLFSNVKRDDSGKVEYAIATIIDISSQKEAQEELKQSELRYKQLVETASDAIYLMNEKGIIIDTNDYATHLLKCTKEDIIGRPIDIVDPNFTVDQFLAFWKDVPYGENRIFETKHVYGENETIPAEISGKKFKIGKETYYFGVARDLRDRKAKEVQIRNQRDLFELVINSVPARIFWKDLNSVYLGCNAQFADDCGMARIENVVGKKDGDLVWKEHAPLLQSDDREVMETGVPKLNYEEIFEDSSGHKQYWKTKKMPLQNADGVIIGVVGIAENITREKEAEIQLVESEAKFRGIFNHAPIGIALANGEGKQIDANDKLLSMLGYTRAEYLSMNFQELSHPSELDNELKLLEKIRSGKIESYYLEKQIKKKDNDYLWVNLSLTAWRDATGKVDVFLAMINDISDRLIAEKQLIIAKDKAEEGNRLKTEFLNNMSHEIRTPMNGIIGFAEMLCEEKMSDEQRNYYLQIIRNSSEQLLHIIEEILEISTLETRQVKIFETSFSLNDLLMELYAVRSVKSNELNIPIYIRKALPDKFSYIISDKSRILKILDNLLDNALKYTDQGYIEMGYRIEDDRLVMFVKDTGIGVAEENYEKIFERFSQESKEVSNYNGGLGLGLSISRENAILLGGDIFVESEKGNGSTFWVSIPYQPAGDKNIETAKTKLSGKENAVYTILVAEDEEVNYLFVEALLQKSEKEFEVIHAINGAEALKIGSNNDSIDIVLMDVKMPVMNGYEASLALKKIRPDLPIIALTAYSTEADKQTALRNGCDNFLSKPIDKNHFFEMIEYYLK